MKKIYPLIAVILCTGILSSCKKENKNNNNPSGPSKVGSTLDLIKDSVFLYAQEEYLWNTQLPSYSAFNPRSFSNPEDATALSTELNALSQYAINPSTGAPYEYSIYDPSAAKYSFIDDGTETAALNGSKGDYGFDVNYSLINDPLVNDLRVEYVYPGSPAAVAGIKRGYRITSINGSASLSYDGSGYGTGTSANLNAINAAIYASNTISMTLQKPDGTTLTVTDLSVGNYNVNPVLKDTVFNEGNGHVIGYLVFNSFTSDSNADPLLNAAFANFTSQGVTDLVVDLRYNGGGYVSTAEYLDNLIVPAAKSGTLMYNTYYNSNLVSGKDPLLANQWRTDPSSGQDFNYGQINYSVAENLVNFSKIGSLNVGRVFFIMTDQTASASELTINNLRPEMDVEFVGTTSYGKPVGFFDININKYTMFTPEFSVQNSAGAGGYYAGFTPGAPGYPGVNGVDDITKDFGDPTESLLADIISDVNTGTYAIANKTVQSVQSNASVVRLNKGHTFNLHTKNPQFVGMIVNRKKLAKARKKK